MSLPSHRNINFGFSMSNVIPEILSENSLIATGFTANLGGGVLTPRLSDIIGGEKKIRLLELQFSFDYFLYKTDAGATDSISVPLILWSDVLPLFLDENGGIFSPLLENHLLREYISISSNIASFGDGIIIKDFLFPAQLKFLIADTLPPGAILEKVTGHCSVRYNHNY